MIAQRAAPLALVGATVAVSVSAILITEARTDAATVVWLRMALAVGLLAPWAAPQLRARMVGGSRRDAVLTAVAGLLLAAHFLTWTASLAYTSVAASVLLVSLHPLIVTPLGARLHGDAVSGRVIAGIVLALAGTVVTCAGAFTAGGNALGGDLLALAGGIALAGYLLIGRSRRRRSGVAAYSAAVYAVVSAAAVGVAAASGTLHAPSVRTLIACLGLAAVCTIGGHTVFNWTLRRLPASTVSLSFLGEPPLAALLAFLILGQRIGLATIVGGALILAGLGAAVSTWTEARLAAAPGGMRIRSPRG
ncbi:MAG: DMT family transporter [Candidatus Dormibacteraeota bacterium]|uniref:DMT family transporter n=1 Tax=Candidatus Aeolococcus gillhamiae TaxID=3127015 RepID=A0A934JS79_9BACT|nr:DMT family transporter [Candidatus Dormibacteraeota bacterium]